MPAESAPLASAAGRPERDIYTVTRLNREAKIVLEGSFPPVWVQGEISNLARPGSGHLYFTLKDQFSQVRCAMFRNRNRFLRFTPENGALVLVNATVSLYEGRGEFQLIVEQLEPAGEGALQRAFEELKKKLHGEGLFDDDHKKPIPAFPRNIGVITSPTGAALRDILNVLQRRFRLAGVIVYPTPVQGAGAAAGIAGMIALAGARRECDVLVLARGGGSLEDLWAFNDEGVARAIYACPLPVVTGIGHEIDFTIADFTADRRAPTPSAAAELVSPDQLELGQRLGYVETKLRARIRERLALVERHLVQIGKRLPHPARILQSLIQRVDDFSLRLLHGARRALVEKRSALLECSAGLNRHNPRQVLRLHVDRCAWLQGRLGRGIRQALERMRTRIEAAGNSLNVVSPLATLRRGYAIVTDRDKRIVVDAAALAPGDPLNARFASGGALATVLKTWKNAGD
ncbi:MAG: exodeoxyribonuclease VII large subunit [Gammaproteobacteria bacterium]|nr:exodeoxyribonuclease VII large subunit [Gammaproteobacteria bacterium]